MKKLKRGQYIGEWSGKVLEADEYEAYPLIPGTSLPGPLVIKRRAVDPVRKVHGIKPVEGVISDVTPYKSMVTGEMITGRRQHREHLHRHRLVEVGNDYNTHKQKPAPDNGSVGMDIKRALEQHGYGD
jgi:hypothetical protein